MADKKINCQHFSFSLQPKKYEADACCRYTFNKSKYNFTGFQYTLFVAENVKHNNMFYLDMHEWDELCFMAVHTHTHTHTHPHTHTHFTTYKKKVQSMLATINQNKTYLKQIS